MPDIVKIVFFSLASVLYLFIVSKLMGKKQIAQLEFIDYAIGISIGSIAAEMATDLNDTPWYFYLLAITIFFLFDITVTYLGRKGSFLKGFLKGSPITIIYNGKIHFKNLKKSKLDINDVICMCRIQGYFDINDIAFAIFETSGQLSVLPKGNQKPTVIEDFDIKPEEPELPHYIVIDGKISYSCLNELKKDEKWLYYKLDAANKQDLKNIIIATYDKENDKMQIHTKKN